MYEDKDCFMFDLYGTLVDIRTDETIPLLWSSLANYYSLKGVEYNDTDLRLEYERLCARKVIDTYGRLRKSRHKISEEDVEIDLLEVFKELFDRRKVTPEPSEVIDAAVMFRSISLVKLRLYEGASEVLAELRRRGKKIYLLSNAQSCFTVPELRYLKIYDSFDKVFISSDVGVKKPSLAFYSKALGKTDPDTCVMIGNDEFADVRGAMGVGIEACYIQTEQSPSFPRSLPGDRISSLWDLIS